MRSGRERRQSGVTDHYQRQALTSVMLEEGRSLHLPFAGSNGAAHPFPQDYVIGQTQRGSASLARADTGLSPLDEQPDRHEYFGGHPGDKVGDRRATETLDTVPAPGDFQTPCVDPSDGQEIKLEKQWASSRAATAEFDTERGQKRAPTFSSPVKNNSGIARRLYSWASHAPTLRHSTLTGLDFVTSMPTVHASAILSNESRLSEQLGKYVIDYKYAAGKLHSSPPHPFRDPTDLQGYLKENVPNVALRLIYTCNDDTIMKQLNSDFGINGSTL